MYCKTCNKTFPQGTAFCDTCGGRLESEGTSVQNPTVNQPSTSGYTYQPNQAAHSFTPPPYPMSSQVTVNNHMTTLKWIGVFILNCIPVVGFIAMLVWAFGSGRCPSLKSFARAFLILFLLGIIISVVISVVYGPMIVEMIQDNFPDLLENFNIG